MLPKLCIVWEEILGGIPTIRLHKNTFRLWNTVANMSENRLTHTIFDTDHENCHKNGVLMH